MGAAWIPPALSLFAFLGAGGPALGLIRLLCPRSRWGTVAVLASGAAAGAFAAAALLAVQPAGVWFPPAVLLGLCVLLGLPCRQFIAALGAQAQRPFHSPFVQAACLLVGCPALALWAVFKEPAGASGIEAVLRENPPLERQLVEIGPSPLATDKGQPVCVARRVAGPEQDRARQTVQGRLLHREDMLAKLIALPGTSAECNCHGWVFTGGLYWLRGEAVEGVLADNGYRQVAAPQLSDLAVYRDPSGTIMHSGVVRATTPDGLVLVESKWGEMGAFIHPVDVHPYEGSSYAYHRSPRDGHRLREAPGGVGVAVAAAAPPGPRKPPSVAEPPASGE
jgi:hypothetical protein